MPSCAKCAAAKGDLGPDCKFDGSGAAPSGPAAGDPVNLATQEEEYRPEADLEVYNPTGPSVVWSHSDNSMSSYGSGFGYGWTHPYNVGVAMPPWNAGGSTTPTGEIVFDNGARIALTAPAFPTANAPVVDCTVPNGIRLKVQWKLDSASGTDSVEVTFPDRSKWIANTFATVDISSPAYFRPLSRMVDRVGQLRQLYHTKRLRRNQLGAQAADRHLRLGGTAAAGPRLRRQRLPGLGG